VGRLGLGQNAPQRDRLVLDVFGLREPGVHGDEVVLAIHLNTVAGVVDDGPVGLGRPVAELLEDLLQPRTVQVLVLAHLRKAEAAECRRDARASSTGLRSGATLA
jgi:hypothetical protein